MFRRDVLKCLMLLPIVPFVAKPKEERVLVTIINHSDTECFVVRIEGNESTISTICRRISPQKLTTSVSCSYVEYWLSNTFFDMVVTPVLEQYENVDYKIIWEPAQKQDTDTLDKGIAREDWLVARQR